MGLAFLITSEHLSMLSERKVLKEAEYSALLDATSVVEVAGEEEGLAQARAEHAKQMVAEAVAAERQLQALRGAMARIVAHAVEQFVAQADPTELLAAALQRVDLLVREEPFVTVRVAPRQEPHLRKAIARLGDDAGWRARLSILTDSSLAEQSCVLQTASGTLSIGLDAQIEAFRAAVERSGVLTPAAEGVA
jgi:type III secretion protein L